MDKPYDTLVISGCSTNGIVTLGAVQKLYDDGMLSDVSTYIGTSSGSIISVLMAVGYSPIDALCYMSGNKIYSKISIFNAGSLFYQKSLIDMNSIETVLSDMVCAKLGYVPTLAEVKHRLGTTIICCAYNVTDHRAEYISFENYPEMLVTTAMCVSSSCPFIFEPYAYNDKYYIDGGIVDNFPILYADSIRENCLGVCNTVLVKPYTPDTGHFEFMQMLFNVMVHPHHNGISKSAIISLEYESNFFNFNSTPVDMINLFDSGYEKCRQFITKNEYAGNTNNRI